MSRWQYSCEKTGPGTLAGRYMRQFWQPIHEIKNIAPGGAKPVRVMGEDFTLYRGDSGKPYLVAHHCAHRGTQLSVGHVEGEEIACLYHGWRYTGDGQCTAQPGELEHQFADRVKIRAHPEREYHGLIFAYLGEGAAPDFPIFPELEGDGVMEARSYHRKCNLTNFLDNQLDEVHVGFTHPVGYARLPEIPEVRISRTDFTAISHCSRPGRVDRITEFLIPNIMRFKSTSRHEGVNWASSVAWRVPEDDGATHSYLISLYDIDEDARDGFIARQSELWALPVPDVAGYARRILGGEITYDEAMQEIGEHDRRYDTTLQDHLTMQGQTLVADRDAEVLGRADAGVVAVRDLWNEQLADFEKHGERRAWVQPPPTIPTSGEDRTEAAE